MTAGLLPLMVKLLFLVLLAFLFNVRSPKPTSLAIALAVSLLKMGDMISGLAAFLFGEWGGLTELFSLDELEPKSLSCALSELLGLSSCKRSASFFCNLR